VAVREPAPGASEGDVNDVEIAEVGRVVSPNVGLLAFGTVLAIFAPQAAAAVYLAVVVIALIRSI
jgi:hypothetical protein